MRIRQFISLLLVFFTLTASLMSCGKNEALTDETESFDAESDSEETKAKDDDTETETEAETEYVCPHEWSEWIIISGADTEHEGLEMHICRACGERQRKTIAKLPVVDHTVQLEVENIKQMPYLPNGCEIVSLAIVLNYFGFNVDAVELSDQYLIRGEYGKSNPFYKYVGDPKSDGMGCYAPCLVKTAENFLSDNDSPLVAKDISDTEGCYLEKWIDTGVPVILWGTTYMDCDPMLFRKDVFIGKDVTWRAHSHCLVLIGYTANTYIFCDPLCEDIAEYQKSDVLESRSLVYRQACVVYDPDTVPAEHSED